MKAQHSTCRIALAAIGGVIGLPAQADLIIDSHAQLSMRNFYFNSDNREGAAAPSKTEEWAQGFLLDLRSGFTEGVVWFGVDATAMLGLTLDSGRGRHLGGSMIPSDGDGAADHWSSAGLTAKMKS